MHDFHEGLPNFDERQIWHDGCGECEDRGERIAVGKLDHSNFERAWERAADWNRDRVNVGRISRAEKPLLEMLWSIQVQLERRGWPLGVVPTGNVVSLVTEPR